jgi:branched-chain amino acid transport system permease protein
VIILVLELLREVKGMQEIAFGALLVGFVLFMRGGLIVVLRRYIRGWEEPLRMTPGDQARALPRPEPQPRAADK